MRALIIGVALFCSACGSTPIAPTPPPPVANLAGSWSGTMQYTKDSGSQLEAIVMSLTQADASVNGTWATGLRNGTVTGTTTPTSFSGSMTYNSASSNGVACTGTLSAAGTAGAVTFQWTSPVVTENCTDPPRNITIAMQRR